MVTGRWEACIKLGVARYSDHGDWESLRPCKIRQEIEDVARISRVPKAMTENSSVCGGVAGSGL